MTFKVHNVIDTWMISCFRTAAEEPPRQFSFESFDLEKSYTLQCGPMEMETRSQGTPLKCFLPGGVSGGSLQHYEIPSQDIRAVGRLCPILRLEDSFELI